MQEWFSLAFERKVVLRAATCALIVGFILILINHGDAILTGDVSPRRWLQMGLTMLVPYCVSTFSSVGALRSVCKEDAV